MSGYGGSGLLKTAAARDAFLHRQQRVAAMHGRFALAVLIATLAMTPPAFASCVTNHFRFFSRGDAVTTRESLSSGDTCFHTLRNNPLQGNIFQSAAIVQNPSHGAVAIGGSGFQYRSSAGYRGSDSYAVKICMQSSRGQGCSTVTFNADIN
jgi:hypothetical protein